MDILFIVLVFIVLLAALFFIPGILLRRAVRQVIKIFRRHSAYDEASAKTSEEMGLAPRPFLKRMMSLRDYKPYALTVMINAGVVLQNEEGKFYLSENKLMESNLRKYA